MYIWRERERYIYIYIYIYTCAHQVDREFQVQSALQGTAVPVARMHGLCTDRAVLGSTFYVMDFVPGRVLGDERLPGFSPAERTALWSNLADVLADLHVVDATAAGLGSFGRGKDFFARQLRTWHGQVYYTMLDYTVY